jgi:hypothetical protein
MNYEKPGGMKKILFFLLLLFCIPIRILAINGDGSFGSPYYGPLTTDMTWSGTVYVNGDITVNGYTLTTSPGAIIIFLASNTDLIITGSGILTASGSSGSKILFTADFNNNGIYGESGERWGHITFQSMDAGAGGSTINNCILEYGDVSSTSLSPANPNQYGGAVQSDFSNLSISNSEIRNNRAGWGGGIFIGDGRNPSISNCYIHDNVATTSGGGIYFWRNSSSTLSNSIITFNNCSGGGGGGGIFIGGIAKNVAVKNCVISHNSASNQSLGHNIKFFNNTNTPKPQFINSIIWYPESSIVYVGSLASSSDFVNCAIQGYTHGYTNCINLNSSNTAADGPNFANPDGGDYSIPFISPCRDAGITTDPAIALDYIGNPRVGPYDIGAYEVQYSRWTGTTSEDWSVNTNWTNNTIPSGSSIVVIPVATNVAWITAASVTVDNLIIESGGSLLVFNNRTLTASTVRNLGTFTITLGTFNTPSLVNENIFTMEAGARSTLTTLTNNGTINLNSIGGVAIPSLMLDTYTGTGTTNIAMHLSGGGGTNAWNWHYVAVPVNYIGDKTMFTSINAFDLMQYDDSQITDTPTSSDNEGWDWHDGYGGTPGFADLIVGRGYAFYHSGSSAMVNFSGISPLMTSLGSLPLQYSGGGKTYPALYGFNLLGNSLTCGLNWDLVTLNGDINSSVYYTIGYKIGSYVQGSGGYGINSATNHIPPLQGFLVKANATSTSIDFSAAREHNSQFRYKKGLEVNGNESKENTSVSSVIKLELNNSGNQDETLIWFNENATNTFDKNYDGLKLLSSGYDQIYTLAGTDKFGISGIPYPADGVAIPVAVKFRNAGTGYKIIASQLQGLENYNLTLTDKGNSNFIVDLKSTNTYTFSSEAGTFPDRFVLTIGTIATAISDVVLPAKPFNVFTFNNTLNIDLLNETWDGKVCTVNIYNLTGKPVLQNTRVELFRGDIKKIPLNLPQGIYIVEIKAENQKFVTKINIIK